MSPPSSPNRTPGYTPNVFTGLALSFSRLLLFCETKRFMYFIFAHVCLFSLLPIFSNWETDNYFVQKHNIFNQYGVKLGWFWTLAVVGPFIYLTSCAHDVHQRRLGNDLGRLGIATVCWYSVTTIFHKVLERTSFCHGALNVSRDKCRQSNGVWTPGLDISGHIFLMVYSMLIIHEEAKSFKCWNQLSKHNAYEGASGKAVFAERTKNTSYSFLALAVLLSVWLWQITISCIYYHIWYDKVFAAIIAIICWFTTYNGIYKNISLTLLCQP
ncbi:unnamed protein product [Auanema sp. JU1783]|nr:unnamed protein product [Auanema sp. JU1783]